MMQCGFRATGVPSAALGGSGRLKAGLGAATWGRRPVASAPADDRGSPGEAGAEGGQRDHLSWREASVPRRFRKEDGKSRRGAIAEALDVVPDLVAGDLEFLRHEFVDSQICLMEEE